MSAEQCHGCGKFRKAADLRPVPGTRSFLPGDEPVYRCTACLAKPVVTIEPLSGAQLVSRVVDYLAEPDAYACGGCGERVPMDDVCGCGEG